MHIFDLGICQYLIGAVFMRLILKNFGKSTKLLAPMRHHENLKHLRRRLWAYYASLPRNRGRMSAIGKLTSKMLGTTAQPRLKAKAAESRNLVRLLPQRCRENPDCFADTSKFLAAACTEMDSLYKVMQAEPRQMTSAGLRQLRQHMTRFLTYWKAFGGHLVPKHHFAWHIVERADRNGNPMFYWTYADEQENRVMSAVAKSLHGGNTFCFAVLEKVLS